MAARRLINNMCFSSASSFASSFCFSLSLTFALKKISFTLFATCTFQDYLLFSRKIHVKEGFSVSYLPDLYNIHRDFPSHFEVVGPTTITLQPTTIHVPMVVGWTEQIKSFPMICITFLCYKEFLRYSILKFEGKICHHEKKKTIGNHHQ